MFQRIVESIAAKILQRVAGGRLAFWRWPNVSRLFSALSFLAVLGLGACNDLSMPDGSDAVAAGQANILVKNTTAETLTVGLDRNADDQGALNDERIEVPAGSEHEFEVEISGDFRKVWLKRPGYAAEPITLAPKDYKEFPAARVFSCVDMQFSSYTTSAKGIKMIPKNPENIAGSSVGDNPGESGCQAFAQNLITGTANAAGEANGTASNVHQLKIEDGTRGQARTEKFSIVIKADYTAKVRFEKLDDLIGFRDQSDKSLVDLTKDGEALELQMTEDPHKFVQENAVPELELNFVDGTAAEISFDDKENWIPLSAIDTPTSQKFEVEYSDADGDELGYLLMANVKASKNGSTEEVEAENKIDYEESVTKENYTKDPSKTHELELYSPVKGKSDSEIANMSRDQRHRVEVTARVDDGMKDGRGRAEVTRTLYVNVAPEIEALQFGDGTDVSDIVETEKDNWLQLDSGDKTSFSVAATDADDGTDLSYSWTVNDQAVGENKDTVELDLGSLAKDHKVEVSVTVSDGVTSITSEPRTLYVNVKPRWPQAEFLNKAPESSYIREKRLGPKGGNKLEYEFTVDEGEDPDGGQLKYKWKVKNSIKDFVFTPENSRTVTVELPLGKHTISVQLIDGDKGQSDWIEKDIDVKENNKPTITNIQVKKHYKTTSKSLEDGAYDSRTKSLQLESVEKTSFSVEANDPDGDALTYSWTVNGEKQQDKKTATLWLNQDFLASASKNKDHKVVVAVSVSDDNGQTAAVTETRTLFVNMAPKITVLKADDKDVGSMTTADHNSWLQLDKKDQLVKLSVEANDPDGDAVTYSWEVNGKEQQDKKTATLLLSQDFLASASKDKDHKVEVTVTVSDCVTEVSETRTLYVNVKPSQPTIHKESSKPMGLSTREYTFKLVGSDPDDNNLTYDWNCLGCSTIDKSRKVTVLQLSDEIKIKARLIDKFGGVSEWSPLLSFPSKRNSPPKIKVLKADDNLVGSMTKGNKNSWLQLDKNEQPVNLSVEAEDADGDILTYTWTVNGNEKKKETGKDGETLLLSQDFLASASKDKDHQVNVKVTVSDGVQEETLMSTLYVNVAPTQPTEIKATPGKLVEERKKTLEQGPSERKYTLEPAGGKDLEGDQLGYEWQMSQAPNPKDDDFTPFEQANKQNSSKVNVTLRVNKTYTIRVRLKDEHGGEGAWFVSKEITVGNHAPTITSLSGEDSKWADEANDYKSWIQLDAWDSSETKEFTVVAEDLDGDNLTYTWTVNGETPQTKDIQVTKKLTGETVKLQLYSPMKTNGIKDGFEQDEEKKRHKVVVTAIVSDGVMEVSETRTLYVNVAPEKPIMKYERLKESDTGKVEWKLELGNVRDPDGDDNELKYVWQKQYEGDSWSNLKGFTDDGKKDASEVTVWAPSTGETNRVGAQLKDEHGGEGEWYILKFTPDK